MKKAIKGIVLLYFFLGSSLQASEIDDIKKQIQQKEFEQAYQLADSIKLEFEGDPVFDYYYALASLETGHPDKALFAL